MTQAQLPEAHLSRSGSRINDFLLSPLGVGAAAGGAVSVPKVGLNTVAFWSAPVSPGTAAGESSSLLRPKVELNTFGSCALVSAGAATAARVGGKSSPPLRPQPPSASATAASKTIDAEPVRRNFEITSKSPLSGRTIQTSARAGEGRMTRKRKLILPLSPNFGPFPAVSPTLFCWGCRSPGKNFCGSLPGHGRCAQMRTILRTKE